MKKFDWKKVIILVFALVLCFSLAACNDTTKPTGNDVDGETFVKALTDGLGGILETLGDTKSGVRHIDATVIVKVGTDNKKAGETANYTIRIAGNFTKKSLKDNDVLIEIKDVNAKKTVLGLYMNDGKIYLNESLTTANEQKLKFEGTEALELGQYLSELPDMLGNALGSLNLKETLDSLPGMAGGILDELLTITKDGNDYRGELKIKELDSILGLLEGANVDLSQYASMLNLILPSVLGITIDSNGSMKIGEEVPSVTLVVKMTKGGEFNGLSFDYNWTKGDKANGVSVEVGLQDLDISNTSKTVTNAADFKDYKEGALKVSAEFNIPGLQAAGFHITGDLYVKPGVGSVEGGAAEENQFINFKLVTADVTAVKDGIEYPLAAEYKYVDVKNDQGEVTGRTGRIYFDIAALCKMADITVENTKFYEDFDIAKLLIGLTHPEEESGGTTEEPQPNKSIAVYDENMNLDVNASEIPDGNAFEFIVKKANGNAFGKTYYFLGTDGEDVTSKIEKAFEVIAADVAETEKKPGFDLKLFGAWKEKTRDTYKMYTLEQIKAAGLSTALEYSQNSDNKIGLFTLDAEKKPGIYTANIAIQLIPQNTDLTTLAKTVYDSLKENGGLDKYLAEGLSRYVQGKIYDKDKTPAIPAMWSAIEVYGGNAAFNFDIGNLGDFVALMFDKIKGLADADELSVNIADADDILAMGPYLSTHELFAAQIRMLLSNEKSTDAYLKNAVNAPYMMPTNTYKKPASIGGTDNGSAVDSLAASNNYDKTQLYLEVLYLAYGQFTEDQLKADLGLTAATDKTTAGIEGWTLAQVEAYGKLEGAKAKTEYYFATMKSTYSARVKAHDAVYQNSVGEFEKKALTAIKGYIGNDGSLDSVTTVQEFLYGKDGKSGLEISLKYRDGDKSVIDGMNLSAELMIKRGTTLIGSIKIGAQFIEASDIPENLFAEDYWDGAKSVHEGVNEVNFGKKLDENGKEVDDNVIYSDVVRILLEIHAKKAGFEKWTDVTGGTLVRETENLIKPTTPEVAA